MSSGSVHELALWFIELSGIGIDIRFDREQALTSSAGHGISPGKWVFVIICPHGNLGLEMVSNRLYHPRIESLVTKCEC